MNIHFALNRETFLKARVLCTRIDTVQMALQCGLLSLVDYCFPFWKICIFCFERTQYLVQTYIYFLVMSIRLLLAARHNARAVIILGQNAILRNTTLRSIAIDIERNGCTL